MHLSDLVSNHVGHSEPPTFSHVCEKSPPGTLHRLQLVPGSFCVGPAWKTRCQSVPYGPLPVLGCRSKYSLLPGCVVDDIDGYIQYLQAKRRGHHLLTMVAYQFTVLFHLILGGAVEATTEYIYIYV